MVVDIRDPYKILTVETDNLTNEMIKEIVKKAGYDAKEIASDDEIKQSNEMNGVQLSVPVIEDLKEQEYKSVIIFGASNLSELKDSHEVFLQASKELVFDERVTQNSFHVAIDDPVLIEIAKRMNVFIEIQ